MNVTMSVPSPPTPPPEGEGSFEKSLRDFHIKETLMKSASGRKRKAHGAQRPRHIK
jgi:hypothetical protein